ncbi:MAG: MFS transporter [Burkholderiales bacterium]|nr:MFS transporter [Burkholderiales bacterium]
MTQPDATHANPPPSGQFALLRQRRVAPFFWTQFCGAGNDNVFKVAFTSLITYQASRFSGLDAGTAAFVISAVFILPFVLFSATSGQLADKYDKAAMMRLVKNLEIAIMALGAIGFLGYNAAVLLGATFLMGLHSTLFGPVKYAYLPQHLQPEELTGGNGMVEMGTFVAILLGTIVGGQLASIPEAGPAWVAGAALGIALLGRAAAAFIPSAPPSDPGLAINWNPVTETWKNLKIAKTNRTVFLSLLGISWLWFFGATFLTSFFNFAKDVLGGDTQVVTMLLAVFSLGVGVGSLLCERLSGHKVEIGLVPFGSIGMTVFAADLYFASRGLQPAGVAGLGVFFDEPAHWRVLADLFLLSMFAGFYSVPLYALIQSRCEPTHRARIIAANNILNAFFMIASALLGVALLGAGSTIPQLFLVTALLNAVVAIYIYSLVPEFLMRFLCWLLVHSVYRVAKKGIDLIPDEGPAVIVCNHVSFVDALIIMAASPRPVRFVMDHQIFKIPVLAFVFRTARAIPIAPAKENPVLLEQAYDEVARALAAGDLVGVFPEGRITDNGELYPFRNGIQKILARTPVPVVPIALQGLWGSFFSRKGGPAMTRPLRRGILSRIGLVVGAMVPPERGTPEHLQAVVAGLRGEWR